jgi:GntP family gluconate:H+ symporter
MEPHHGSRPPHRRPARRPPRHRGPSATVAIVTTAGIVQPIVAGGHYSQAHLALVIMAISAGSIFASHVNDGGFWMVAKYFGISERDTLRTWTVLETVLSVVGGAVAVGLSAVV